MARRDSALPWNRLAGAIEEQGSALALLQQLDDAAADQLFTVDEKKVTLDQLEDHVHTWEAEGIELVDYAVHSWDIREGSGEPHALEARSADLLVPLCFVLWSATARVGPDTRPREVGVRITSGENAGETRMVVSPEGLTYSADPIDDLPTVIEFDPASFVLTAYGRMNAGTIHGDRELAYQGDPETGRPTEGCRHEHHIWDVDKVKALVADRNEPVTFFCGGSRNFSKFLDLFDRVFVLEVDLATLNQRLDERPDVEWGGGKPTERELIVQWRRTSVE